MTLIIPEEAREVFTPFLPFVGRKVRAMYYYSPPSPHDDWRYYFIPLGFVADEVNGHQIRILYRRIDEPNWPWEEASVRHNRYVWEGINDA